MIQTTRGDCPAAIRAGVRILAGRVLAEDQSYSVSTLIRKLYVLHCHCSSQCISVAKAEFLNFLKEIDAQVPEGIDIHIVMDNYATHKTPKIKAWLARRPHYHVHFTPTSASWINQVERWFAELTRKQLQRGVHTSVRQLEADIRSFIDRHNQNPRPFKWTKSADQILASVKRFCHKAQHTLCGEL